MFLGHRTWAVMAMGLTCSWFLATSAAAGEPGQITNTDEADIEAPCQRPYLEVELGGLPARVPAKNALTRHQRTQPFRTAELGGLPARVPFRGAPAAMLAEACPERGSAFTAGARGHAQPW